MIAIPRPARSWHVVAALAAGVLLASPACAQGGPPDTSWSLGIGAISMQKPYAGVSRENKALPVLQFENRYLRVFGPQIGFKVLSLDIDRSERLDFTIIGRYDLSGYEAKDSPRLAGMSERKSGFWAGTELQWKNAVADLKATWLVDASGNSKGSKFGIAIEKTWHIDENLMLTPRVGASWSDSKSIDYYYGVRASEVRAGRPAYTGKAGTGAEAGVRGTYLFDSHHAVFIDLAFASLPKSVKDSPLVDRSSENRLFMGYTFRFR